MTIIARLTITKNRGKITNGNSGVGVGVAAIEGDAVGLAVGISVTEVTGVGLEREACEFKAMTMLWLLW